MRIKLLLLVHKCRLYIKTLKRVKENFTRKGKAYEVEKFTEESWDDFITCGDIIISGPAGNCVCGRQPERGICLSDHGGSVL